MECPLPDSVTTPYKSLRINVLLAIAYATILICLAVTVWVSDIKEYAQGILTLILGRFLGYTDSVYAFEFGSTRQSKEKDATISNLSGGASKISSAAPAPASTTVAVTELPK